MSEFLFLLALVHEWGNSRQQKKDKVEFHNSAGGPWLCRWYKFSDLHEKTGKLAEEAAKVGLKLNEKKCTTLRTEFAHRRESIVVNGEEVEDVASLHT